MRFNEKQILVVILLLAAFLRFWGLGSAEFYHDEGFTAFRSIGYLDYIQNDDQTTPIQWFKDAPSLPWWTKLSFHDHPPLFFLIQNIFFKIFGNSLFAARLPSALAGVFSIYLVYLISSSIFGTSDVLKTRTPDVQELRSQYSGHRESRNRTSDFHIAGLLAAFLLSVNLIHIWISRSSLFESVQIFFILLNIYYFFRVVELRRFRPAERDGIRATATEVSLPGFRLFQLSSWPISVWMFGFTLGLAFLTKYTSVFLVPVYIVYLFVVSRKLLVVSQWCAALGLALLLFSPVLIYNFYLYKTVGHFDLQFAYLFRQETPEWRASLGKIQDPFSEIISNLTLMYSIPFLLAALAGIGYAVYEIYNSYRANRTYGIYLIFWLLNFIFITLMLVKVGSAFRFIVLYAAPAVMLIAYLFDYFYSKLRTSDVPNIKNLNSRTSDVQPLAIILKILLTVFLAYELFFAIDIFRTFPDFGIAALDHYFDVELGQKRSLAIPASSNPHLDRLLKMNAQRIPASEKPTIIIYDENIALSPRLWVFTRRTYYSGFPSFTVTQFKNFLKNGTGQFSGYDIYFAKASRKTYLNPVFHSDAAEDLELFLNQELRLNPAKTIYGYDNLLMFTVYKFKL